MRYLPLALLTTFECCTLGNACSVHSRRGRHAELNRLYRSPFVHIHVEPHQKRNIASQEGNFSNGSLLQQSALVSSAQQRQANMQLQSNPAAALTCRLVANKHPGRTLQWREDLQLLALVCMHSYHILQFAESRPMACCSLCSCNGNALVPWQG